MNMIKAKIIINIVRAAGVRIYQRNEIIIIGKITYQKLAIILKTITIRPQNAPKIVPIIEAHNINNNISSMVAVSFEDYDSIQLYKVDNLRDSIRLKTTDSGILSLNDLINFRRT